MLGCDRMTAMVSPPTTADSKAGTSQFATHKRLALTVSNTSPGIAKTFSSRAANDIADGGGASSRVFGGDSRTGRGSSIQQNSDQSWPKWAHKHNMRVVPGCPAVRMPPELAVRHGFEP